MSDKWASYDPEKSSGPLGFSWKMIVLFFSIVLLAGIAALFVGGVLHLGSETAQLADEQFGPQALLTKYTEFKELSAACDKIRADIEVTRSNIEDLKNQYLGVTRNQWDRRDIEQYNLWKSTITGQIAKYNSLASDYNTRMKLFNYRFTNVGDLPAGQTIVLPREYKPYVYTAD